MTQLGLPHPWAVPLGVSQSPLNFPSTAGKVGQGGLKVAVAGGSRAHCLCVVCSHLDVLTAHCSNCEKIKNRQANLDSRCIFCIFEDSSLKPGSGEGSCLPSPGALVMALPDSGSDGWAVPAPLWDLQGPSEEILCGGLVHTWHRMLSLAGGVRIPEQGSAATLLYSRSSSGQQQEGAAQVFPSQG